MPKRVLSRTALCLIGLVLALLPLPALAITLVPTGLNPGDTYHLAFLTSTTRVATSFAIADYNAFVQAAADAVVGIGAGDGFTWKAIASTSSDDARDNIGVITSPIYRLDDTLIASDESDLFDGTLLAALNITELGTVSISFVWTGSTATGIEFPGEGLGIALNPRRGRSFVTGPEWLDDSNLAGSIVTFPLYAVSSEQVVPDPIPEPATVGLLGSGLVGLAGWGWRQMRSNKA